MRILADYHTHTRYSHGRGTIEDNVKSAIQKGLKVIGITDHGSAYLEYGINKLDYKKMREIVDRLNEKYAGAIQILLGIEANIIDQEGNLDVDDMILKNHDILLAGFHFDIAYKDLLLEVRSKMKRHENIQSKIDQGLYEEMIEINTQAMTDAVKKYPIHILTHAGDQQPIDIEKVCKVLEKTNTDLEINNFHKFPTIGQLKIASTFQNINFVISSDAHRPKDVGNFTKALKVLKKSGLNIERVKNIVKDEK
ncbi:MAG: PHP domain-containing protein [Marinisporobacter sp.]|jgi:putative hydrolase|nr:PHP domain-containing protein [Marinisporobacter sp.]